ncbi:nicotinate-nucleotide--dimethylbenzimidazole phosphoribosyltransferase [Fictibacillus sp. S7]|uniref:nicotinate-nucleotide--dimethylbenzimidazole phosphoribosyltransferase n=1 Tax=Fictibacillus sp. S7 TaxID=2212476 RepID=UPI0010117442|nr:nicotinate-nucleotide--dimethylbenzimidazole phosphoribosyltransferase [Fictibacillus sp. S7]RXZ00337.1 nicotinate-nucleotide--dimethylbenzimidazole phosphoribosyltransferase [Fictibacillus sp. S7]
MKNHWKNARIPAIDEKMGSAAQTYIHSLTKPVGSLGRLEALAVSLASMTKERFPIVFPPGVLIFAADHGIVSEGVSAYPQEVTSQMVRNFLNGGAAINVFSKQIGAKLNIVDIGIAADIDSQTLISRKVRYGTANFLVEDAMTREDAEQAVDAGYQTANEMIKSGVKCLIPGEMGIGNTTASSAVVAVVSGEKVGTLVGTGTGIKKEKLQVKKEVIQKALELRKPNADDPVDILSKVGGLEIAGMAGAMLAASSSRIPILVDGFIASTAALIAKMICSRSADYMIMGHRSVEPGHTMLIKLLEKEPILDLGMRLGEGSGAAVAFPILLSSSLMINEMATFETAQISAKSQEGETRLVYK